MRTSMAVAVVALAALVAPHARAADDDRTAARVEVARALRSAERAARDGHDPEAVAELERAVAIAADRLPGTLDAANARDALGSWLLAHGRPDEAIAHLEAGLASYRVLLAGPQPRVATSLHNLAVAESRAGRSDAARTRALEALETWDRLPADRRHGRDDTLQLLANLARREGREDEARALEARRSTPAPSD